MNTVEDKELQELFEAKRTVEANRRRQEELRHLIEIQAAMEAKPKVRRLWPVWACAAAASVALLLMTLPALFSSEKAAPTQVAETAVPEVVLPQATPAEGIEENSLPISTRLSEEPDITSVPSPSGAAPAARPLTEEPSPLPFSAPAAEEAPIIETTVETAAPTPRVMRRTSSLIACTEGCKTPEDSHGKNNRDIEITFFANNNSTENVIYSFEINK